jgi:hypothetical protein
MPDYPIAPPIEIRNSKPKRRLRSLAEARDYVEELLRERRFVKFREMLRRLETVKSEDEAVEAAGALRELLAMEELIV